MSDRVSAKVKIVNALGLHARPAMAFADAAAAFTAAVRVCRADEDVDGKSVMQMLMLAATCGSEITIEAHGPDAAACLQALVDLVGRGFDEL